MNPIYIFIVVACAVLATAEPEPQVLGGIRSAQGYHGGRGFGGVGSGQQRGYAGRLGSHGSFRGHGGGRFVRSPAGIDNSGFGSLSYAGQGFQPQTGLPYGADTFADPRFDGFQG